MNRNEFAKKWGNSYEPNHQMFFDCSARLLSDLDEMLEAESKAENLPISHVSNHVCPDCKGTGYIDHPELGHRVYEICHCNK